MLCGTFDGLPLTKWALHRRSCLDSSHLSRDTATAQRFHHSGSEGKTKNFTVEPSVYLFVQFMALQLTGIMF